MEHRRPACSTKPSIILIVDDQPTNLKMLFSFLQESGYKVLVAKRGESALKKLQNVTPDIILLDLMLPGIDGFETCQRLKELPKTKDIPVIFMTALSESRDKIKGLKVGAVDYITKPFQQEEVLARIENQLKIRKLQKQLEEQNQKLQQEISTRRKIEERLELVIRAANDGFWDWNLESGEIYFSPRWKEMLGYSDQELPNEVATWKKLILPEDRIAACQLAQEYNSGRVSRYESTQRFRHKNGSTVYILSRALHLKDESGKVVRAIGASTDITEITKATEALQQSQSVLEGVLNSSLDGVAAFAAIRDSQRQIIDFKWLLLNPAAEKMMGRTQNDLVGKQMLVEMPGTCKTGLFEKYVRVVETGESLEIELYYAHENIQAWLQIVAVKLDDGLAVTFRNITERKQMEKHNRALLDAIPDMMFRQRVDGTFLDVRAKESKFIAPTETRIGGNLCDMPIPEAVKQGLLKCVQAAVETGELQTCEYELLMPDGVHTYESRCVKSGADEAIRIVRDVTSSKQVEVALKESEGRFRGIFENAAIGIGLTGADGRLIQANPTLEAFLGYSEAEMRHQDFANITHPDDCVSDLRLTQEVIDGVRDSFQIEKRYIHKDGQIFWGRLTVSAVRNLEGEFQFTVAILEDINDRKLRELALKESERRFRATFNDSFQFTALLKPNGTVIEANHTALDFGGVKPTDVAGLPLWETCWWREGAISKQDSRGGLTQGTGRETDNLSTKPALKEAQENPETPKQEQLKQAIQRAASGQFVRYEVDVTGVGDSVITLDFSIKPVLDETGKVVLLIPEGRDITDRKKAQERLRLLERAIAASGNSIIISDAIAPDNPIIYVNSGFERMTGYPREEVIGSGYWSYVRIGATPTALEDVQRAIASGRETQVTLRSSRIDGTLFWNELCITPVRDAQGRLTHFISVQTDITRRKQVEEALRISEERLQLAIEGSGMGLWDWNLSTGQIYFSPQWKTMLGYEVEEIPNSFRSWERLVHPEDLPRAIEAINAHFEGRSPSYEVELRMKSKSGEWKWILSQAKVMERDVSGNPVRMTGTNIDVSDRKQAEEALRQQKELLQTIFDHIPVMVAFFDAKGQIQLLNREIERVLGWSLAEVGDIDLFAECYPDPDYRQRVLEQKVAATGKWQDFKTRTRSGSYVDTSWANIRLSDGTRIEIGQDVTERKWSEFEIMTAKAALERQIQRTLLLGQITHEIRSSLKPEQIFQTAATQIGRAFSVNRCLIHTYLEHPSPQIPLVAQYKQPGIELDLSLEIPVIGNPHAQLVLAQDSAIASDDVYADPLLEPASSICQQLCLKSMLAVRTSYQGKANGVICLHQYDSHPPRHWSESEIELLESVAAQMGIAIAQANLLEQETQRRQELALQNQALEKAKHEAEAANLAKSQFLSKMSHELRTPLNAILGFTQLMARDKSLKTEQLEHLGIINRSGEHLLDLINDILSMSKIEAGQLTLNANHFDLYRLLDSLEEMLRLNASSKGLQLIFERTPEVPQYIETDEGKLRQVLINLLGNAIKFTQTGSVTLRVVREFGAQRGAAQVGSLKVEGSDEFGAQRGAAQVGSLKAEGLQNNFQRTNASNEPTNQPTLRERKARTTFNLPFGNAKRVQPSTFQPATLRFEVEDTGPGISPDELSSIFDPFVQTKTGRQSMQGTGLGLPISQQFVRMIGGEITVSSTLGKGAIFTFNIQVGLTTSADEKPISSNRQVIGLEPNQPSYRILVVEDVVENRQLLVEILENLGFEVREATNGQEGIALWKSWSPNLILMDILMPVMNGYEATQQIKQSPKGQDTVIIALTAGAFEEQREAILRSGCDDFLPKPFQQEVLLEKIAHHLVVRYLYEVQQPPTSAVKTFCPNVSTEPLTPEALAVMPASWVTQLHQAALVADDELMNQLLEQIPLEYGCLHRALKELLNDFRLEELIHLTEPAGS